MSKVPIYTDKAPKPRPVYNQAIKANGFVFCSGQLPKDLNGTLVEGTVEDRTVSMSGYMSLDKVVEVNVFLSDIDDFTKMNEIYLQYFGDLKPSRTAPLSPSLDRESVQAAHELIKPYIHRTPTLTNATLTALASTPQDPKKLTGTSWEAQTPAKPKLRLFFKCENFQRIGAFKCRGAFHAIERLKQDKEWLDGGGPEKGVVTHSSGNHAQALALAAATNNIPAYIVIPTISAPAKIAATKGYRARVVFSGPTSTEREAAAAKIIEETGARLIPPYDQPHIVLGQETLGLEFQEDTAALLAKEPNPLGGRPVFSIPGTKAGMFGKGLDAILAPCGGGGMLSGVALSCEETEIRVFGAEPWFQGADDAKRGYEPGARVESVKTLAIADGLRTPVGKVPWSIIYERRLVDGFFNVSETEIRDALKLVLERFKLVIEPSAAVPLAVALFNEDFRSMVEREAGEQGWDLGIVFSGGNVGTEKLATLFDEQVAPKM